MSTSKPHLKAQTVILGRPSAGRDLRLRLRPEQVFPANLAALQSNLSLSTAQVQFQPYWLHSNQICPLWPEWVCSSQFGSAPIKFVPLYYISSFPAILASLQSNLSLTTWPSMFQPIWQLSNQICPSLLNKFCSSHIGFTPIKFLPYNMSKCVPVNLAALQSNLSLFLFQPYWFHCNQICPVWPKQVCSSQFGSTPIKFVHLDYTSSFPAILASLQSNFSLTTWVCMLQPIWQHYN